MPTAIYFNGRRINRPQAVSKIDASALAGVSPAAVGIVALVGTAEGGKPLDASDTQDLTRPEKALERFRSGNLRAACQFCFQPSADEDVPGGAQRIIPVKVNPAVRAAATLPDAVAADSVVFTSADYGLFTNQINLEVATGTTKGKKITVVFEDSSEVFDNVGGDAVFTLGYVPGTEGYGTALATLNATQLDVVATKAKTGLNAERTADISAPGTVIYASTNASDTTQTVTVYGLSGILPVQETKTLNGTTNVAGTQSFSKILGCKKSAATLGTVTVKESATTLLSMTAGVLTRGIALLTNCPAAGALTTVAIDTLAAVDVAIFGKSATGAAQGERWNFTSVLSQAGVATWSQLEVIALGDPVVGRTVTVTAHAATLLHSTYSTVQKAEDRLNALDGFTAAASVTNPTSYLMTALDYVTSVNIFNLTPSFKGDLKAVLDAINNGSGIVTAARATGATSVPTNTTAPVFLAGGIEGVVTITQWQQAFAELKKRRVNIIVPLTNDPAVHALLLSHLVDRAGKLRSEANGYIGIGTAGGAGETKTNIKSQILALQSRHISAISQEIQKFDPDTGEATYYAPWMTAVVAAGMQAGSAIGEPLTYKVPICTDIRQDSSWSTVDDDEEMIDSALMFLEKVDGVGIRWVRSLTTHLADDNVVFSEMSANEALNTAVYRFRAALEKRIGKRGLSGSTGALKGIASDEAGRLVDDEILVAFRNITIEQIGDVYPVSVEFAPVLPINFIPITVHLTITRASA